MSAWRETSDGVWHSDAEVVLIHDTDIDRLQTAADSCARKRARLCAHPGDAAPVHEMLIAFQGATYVCPHRHTAKSESFHVIQGFARVVLFDDDGAIRRVVPLGPPGSGRHFFFRIDTATYHTLLLDTDRLLLHETTTGPFDPSRSQFAPWAPAESAPHAVREAYKRDLLARIDTLAPREDPAP